MQEAEIIKDLAAFLEQLVANDQFSGAVLVAKNGSPLFKQAYGLASKVFNFSITLQENRLLTVEYTNIVLTGKVSLPEPQKTPTSYAYGFFDETINGHRVVGHSGGAPGINSRFQIYMDLGYTVVVLSNYDPPAATQVIDWLSDRLTQVK